PEFQAAAGDTKAAALTEIFNKVLWDDLDYSGGVTLVSRSLYPLGKFNSRGEITADEWTTPAVDAQFIAFGNSRMTGDRIRVEARLWDLKAPQNREMIGKAYTSEATDSGARLIAHQFADAIIELIGGGSRGIALTKIALATSRDGSNKEIYVADWNGKNLRRLTVSKAVNVSPTWNPRTGHQLAFTSDRGGSPQIYIMDDDGTNIKRLVEEGGHAVEPSWSSDGQRIAFAWLKSRTS